MNGPTYTLVHRQEYMILCYALAYSVCHDTESQHPPDSGNRQKYVSLVP